MQMRYKNDGRQRGDKDEMEKWLETKSRCKWDGKTMGDKEEMKKITGNKKGYEYNIGRRKWDENEMEKNDGKQNKMK